MFYLLHANDSCGKSSLMVALFRMEELAGGKILIDGIDISTMPRSALRRKLCIIPQEAVLFSVTIRFNLDPFDEHSDEEIWAVLEEIQLKSHIESLPLKLLEPVADGGENFSVGQRQVSEIRQLMNVMFGLTSIVFLS